MNLKDEISSKVEEYDWHISDPDEIAQAILDLINARLHECVKPLEWVRFGTMAYVANAPMFGQIRVEQFGRNNTWTVCYSVPGYSNALVDGEWHNPEAAKAAAQAHYAAQIIEGLDL